MATGVGEAYDTHHHHLHEREEMYGKSRAKKVFSLETYLAFLRSRDLRDLTVDGLNKIVSIHSFRKLKSRKAAEEAVTAITEPIHPSRSTVQANISSSSNKAFVTLTEAIKDLKALNWQECSITSIRIITSKNYSSPVDISPEAAAAAKLMALRGNKRPRSPTPLATSTMSSGSGPSKSGVSGSGGCFSSSKAVRSGDDGVVRKPRSKRVYVKRIEYCPNAVTALAATASSN